ncbi:MAG: hypothetical protein FJW38_16930 [Acidobacteria bacterium]|nr:hypothetical protein [Acidobacteriota bacterium]
MGFELENLNVVVNSGSIVKCPHGGSVQIETTTMFVLPNGKRAFKWTGAGTFLGCAHRVGGRPQPCVKMLWVTCNPLYTVDAVPGVTLGNVGIGKTTTNAPQGPAIIAMI